MTVRKTWMSAAALAATAALVLGAVALNGWYARPAPGCPVVEGQVLPEMTFNDGTGVVSTAALRGRRSVLLFRTPTCPACKIEAPAWRVLANGGVPFTLWEITLDAKAPAPAPAGDGHVVQLADAHDAFSTVLHASRVPLIVLVDEQLMVRGCFVGVQPAAMRTNAIARWTGQ